MRIPHHSTRIEDKRRYASDWSSSTKQPVHGGTERSFLGWLHRPSLRPPWRDDWFPHFVTVTRRSFLSLGPIHWGRPESAGELFPRRRCLAMVVTLFAYDPIPPATHSQQWIVRHESDASAITSTCNNNTIDYRGHLGVSNITHQTSKQRTSNYMVVGKSLFAIGHRASCCSCAGWSRACW